MNNEVRLQAALGHIDNLNEQIATLRDRRMALAFASELTAPDGSYQPLEVEQRDLQDERELMQADLRRTNQMLENTPDTSQLRMGMERRKLWFQREIERVDEQLGNIDEARVALQNLRKNSNIIHRQGELRILTATIIGETVPHRVREALQSEAFMTVRLESSEDLFTPKVEVASAPEMEANGAE
jgi:hypothetical protein